jgi:hypothetical protein|tara:strand:+ start:268 stop:699 length:432 start_codon:yes stop_codon:yes gene_type:complete
MDYDNTDRGSLFKPRADESLLVQGKIDSNRSEYRLVIIKSSLPDGKTARDVYQKVGTMYENDKNGNEKAPDFSGPVMFNGQDKRRIAAWKTVSKDGATKFLSCRVGDSTPRTDGFSDNSVSIEQIKATATDVEGDLSEDEIPF